MSEDCATCDCCKKLYPHEGPGSNVIMGCCEGTCGREAVCGNCSEYYEEEGQQLCHCCSPKKHHCSACGEDMGHAAFQDGKMCCEEPCFKECEDSDSDSDPE